MLRPALALLLLLVLLPASAHAADDAPPGADPAPAPAVTRASMTWDQPVDIDLHIYDGEGHHAWYADRDDIPDAVLTHDNVSGFEADTTTEDFDVTTGADRRLGYRACYFGGGGEEAPVTHVSLLVRDPGSATPRTVAGTLTHVNDCIDLARSPDSAASTPVAEVHLPRGTITTDPLSGEVQAWMSPNDRSDLSLTRSIDCVGTASLPTDVQFEVAPLDGGDPVVAAAELAPRTTSYTVTFPGFDLPTGTSTIRSRFTCAGETRTQPIGELTLIDPSGAVTNAVTGAPIAGATITLHRMPPSFAPRAGTDDTTPNSCDSPESRVAGAAWTQAVPDGGFPHDPLDPVRIAPAANPLLTTVDGRFAWDVAGGSCWYVSAAMAGFEPTTSGLVGINVGGRPVLDLDLRLTPLPAPPRLRTPLPVVEAPQAQLPNRTPRAVRTLRAALHFGARRLVGHAGRPGAVLVTGQLRPTTCGDRARVAIQRRVGRKWVTLATLTTNRAGAFSTRIRIDGRRVLRTAFAGAPHGRLACTGALTAPRVVRS